MSCPSARLLMLLLLAGTFVAHPLPVSANEPQLTYEKDIRPILKTHCFQCHGEGGVKESGLDLRLRRLVIAGGDSGAAVSLGKPNDSLILARLKAGEMPPAEVKLRPTVEEVSRIENWIAIGAPAAFDEPSDLDPDRYFTHEERSYWAYQQVLRPLSPPVINGTFLQSPVDPFVLSRLEKSGRHFSELARQTVLLRRAYYDFVGLPPSPEEVETFTSDTSPDAYERLLDRLFAQPGYGERWGRHWLDVAGYADSEGYNDEDLVRPDAYKYRDYVVRAWNADKPYNEFIVEQLAGDELIGGLKNLNPEDVDKLVATGFLRMAPDGTDARGADDGVARNEVIAKTIEIVSTSLLGLTVGCAQCHDHRYDPIPQTDYYAFRAIFEPSYNWKNWLRPADRRISLYTDDDRKRAAEIEDQAKKLESERSAKQTELIEQTLQRELAKLSDEIRETVRLARNTPEKERNESQKTLLKQYPSVNISAGSLYLYDSKAADLLKKMADDAASVRATKPAEEFVRALWEPLNQSPPKTFRFNRGELEQPKEEVLPRELQILALHGGGELLSDDPTLPTTGRRLAYARWLTAGRHPLFSRVAVNRIWLHLFGRGIVPTPGNFGALGLRPTHPELLNWLACEFEDGNWSLKRIQRTIATSRAYQQISAINPQQKSEDSQNELFGYQSLRRMEAEVVRDSLLAASGQLSHKANGPPIPVMADVVGQFVIGIENLNAGRPGDVIDMKGEQYRRTVYVQVRRSRPLSVLDPFDMPAMEPNCTVRPTTTVTPQSLFMMNSQFSAEMATAMAHQVRMEFPDDLAQQIRAAWLRIFSAPPTDDELKDALAFVDQQSDYFCHNPHPQLEVANAKPKRASVKVTAKDQPSTTSVIDPELEALGGLCHVLLNTNRFLYVE